MKRLEHEPFGDKDTDGRRRVAPSHFVFSRSEPSHFAAPHSSHLRLHRRYSPGGTFLVTKCMVPRLPVLVPEVAEVIVSTLCHRAERKKLRLAAFVVMPDHWHAVLAPPDGLTISQVMAGICGWVSKRGQLLIVS